MSAVLQAALPVFVLILLGWVIGRRHVLGANAVDVLNLFVTQIALPALLFRAMATITPADLANTGFLLAFAFPMLACCAASFLLDRQRSLATTAIDALSAGYANTAYMGIPICLLLLGQHALLPAVLASLLTVCALFALAIVLVELDLQETPNFVRTLGHVALSLIRNPLVAGPVLGGLYAATRLPLPDTLLSLLTLLGNTASPVALVTIGLFLAEAAATPVRPATLASLVSLKLLVQPALTAALAYGVFRMDPLWARCAVLLAAMPTGTGPFMLAKLYGRDAGLTSRTILVSTVLSVLTVSVAITLLGR